MSRRSANRKTDKVMEALKAATTHDYEVYSFAKKLFQMKTIWWLYYVQFYVKNKYLKMCG